MKAFLYSVCGCRQRVDEHSKSTLDGSSRTTGKPSLNQTVIRARKKMAQSFETDIDPLNSLRVGTGRGRRMMWWLPQEILYPQKRKKANRTLGRLAFFFVPIAAETVPALRSQDSGPCVCSG